MSIEYQQILVIILGGAFIWGVTIALCVIRFKRQLPTTLKAGLDGALLAGVLFSTIYLLLAFQADNALPMLANLVPGFVIMFVAMMIFGFLVAFQRARDFERSMQKAKQKYEKTCEESEDRWRKEADSIVDSINPYRKQ